jgi:polysaccharide pyruvyl transferase WcaK-like protein
METSGRHILFRSSWQSVNIGDIAHTPGALRLLETHVPDARVTLWPMEIERGVKLLLRKRFPDVEIVHGRLSEAGEPIELELRRAFDAADFLLHGSGSGVVARRDLSAWHTLTGKPFGIYGVSLGDIGGALGELLSAAEFVFCRDTDSLAALKASGVAGPVMEFAPDVVFGLDLRDDATAEAYLRAHGLDARSFICVVPRLRYTPYHKIHSRKPTETDLQRQAVSERFKEPDHAKLREVIVDWVRRSGRKVLVCPEMTYQLDVLDELLVAPLPDDVKNHVVRRETYWLTDEAASVYARAHSVISFEMHSPIIAAVNGTPAIHVRQPTDTRKGQMWADIGLADWLFKVDDIQGSEIAEALRAIDADYPAAQTKLADTMAFVRRRQQATMAIVAKSLGG